MSSIAEKTQFGFYQFKHHTLEDIAGMVYGKIISYGEGAEIVTELLSSRYPGAINYNRVYEFFRQHSSNYKEHFRMMFDFGKALEKWV